MSRVVTKSLRKQLEHVKRQHVQKHAQAQDEQQLQLMGDEPMNAPNTDATQRGEGNE